MPETHSYGYRTIGLGLGSHYAAKGTNSDMVRMTGSCVALPSFASACARFVFIVTTHVYNFEGPSIIDSDKKTSVGRWVRIECLRETIWHCEDQSVMVRKDRLLSQFF